MPQSIKITETDDARYTWGALVAGADAPSFTLATYHDSFADLAPDPAMRAQLAEKMTPEGVEAAAQAFAECVETQQANIILVRPDLSYQPTE